MKRPTLIVLAIMMAALMSLAMATVTASAANSEFHVSSYEELNTTFEQLEETTATVILDEDITMEMEDKIIVPAGNFTLDMNGHTITKTEEDVFGQMLAVYSKDIFSDKPKKASLTITGNGTMKYDTVNYYANPLWCYEADSLTIENGTFEGYTAVTNEGKLTINGGTFRGDDIIYNNNSGKTTINGGDFRSEELDPPDIELVSHSCVDDASDNGSVTINGGTFDSGDSDVGTVRFGHITVNGGTFKGKAAFCFSVVDTKNTLNVKAGDFTACEEFFGLDDGDLAMDDLRLKVSDNAKLTTAQRNQINRVILVGNKTFITKATIKGLQDKVYTGKAIKPAVTVTLAGKKLAKGDDYTVTYSNNKSVGKAKVKIEAIDPYMGEVVKYFNINPKGTSISKVTPKAEAFTVKWKKQATQTSGYQVRYSLKSNMAGAKTVTVKGSKKTSKTIKKLKAKKTYYVQVRTYKTVKGTEYCSKWSAKKTVKTKKAVK